MNPTPAASSKVKVEVSASHIWTIFELQGTLQRSDILEAINVYFPKLETVDVIWDFSRASIPLVQEADFQAIVSAVRGKQEGRKDARTVFVCTGETVFKAISEYIALAGKTAMTTDYAVFTSLDRAERWLTCNRKHLCGNGTTEPGYASCPRGNCRSIRLFQAYRRHKNSQGSSVTEHAPVL